MASKLKCEVPFSLAGKGLFFRFTVTDIAELEDIYGEGEYFEKIQMNVDSASAKTLIICLDIGLKCKNDDGKTVRANINFDEIEFPISSAAEPILDALCLQMDGKTFQEVIKHSIEMQAAKDKALDDAVAKIEVKAEDPFQESGELNE